MNKPIAALCLSLIAGFIGSAQADISAQQVDTALGAIQNAKALARAGRGSLLMVGSLLSADEKLHNDVVVVLDYPTLRDMKPGMVLILAKVGCEPIDECLIARRVTDINAKNGLETEPFNGAEGLLFSQVKATLLGSVAYAVDLNSGAIHELRTDREPERSLADAIAEERARTRLANSARQGSGGS
jgi:hypothetical protein